MYAVATRAQLEDDLAAIETGVSRVTVMRAIADADKRLGLDPKALQELRWRIVPDEPAAAVAGAAAPVRRELRAV